MNQLVSMYIANRISVVNTRLLGALLLLILALAFNVNWMKTSTGEMGGDEGEYNSLARNIITGQGFTSETGQATAHRTPGFPLILGAIYFFTDGDVALTRIVLVILTSLTSLALYWICLLSFDDIFIALISGLSWAAMAMTIHLSGLLYGESLAALIFAIALLLSVLAKKYNSDICAGLAGLLMGFAILIRGYLILVILGPFIWLLLWKKRLALVFLLFAMLLPGLWIARNKIVLQALTLSTQTAKELWSGNNAWTRGAWAGYDWLSADPQQLQYMRSKYPEFDTLNEVERSRRYSKEFVVEVTNHPKRIAWLIPRKIFIYLSPASYLGYDLVYAVLLPFSLIGIIGLWKNRELRHWLWLMGFPIIGVMLICILTFGDARFRHPVNAMFAVLAALGLRHSLKYVLFTKYFKSA